MQTLKDLKGKVFGTLTAIDGPFVSNQKTYYLCMCECGIKKEINAYWLKHKAKSCGCLTGLKHGHSPDIKKSKTYSCWDAMVQRCTNKNNKAFKNYGNRGIKLDENWLEFNNFLKDMGEKPEGTSIERINNNLGYNKNNCKWATRYEQNNNTRRNVFYNFEGNQMTLSQASRHYNISRSRMETYIRKHNLSFEDAKKYLYSKVNLRKKHMQLKF